MKLTTLIPVLIFAFLAAPLTSCSGSEEGGFAYDDSTKSEFTKVDESDTPVMPEEPARVSGSDENPRNSATDLSQPQEKPQGKPKKTTVDTTPDAYEKPQTGQTEVQQKPSSTARGVLMWSVQIGAFKDEEGALKMVDEAKQTLKQPIYKDFDPATGFYKVTVGSFANKEDAGRYKADVQANGFPDAFSVEVRR